MTKIKAEFLAWNSAFLCYFCICKKTSNYGQKYTFLSDSRSRNTPRWFRNIKIIDSTTVTLFSNLIFKGVGRNPKTGKKKGSIKVHTTIHANEGVPCDVQFTSAATHDHFLLSGSSKLARNTFVDMIDELQIDSLAAGLHRSDAVKRYQENGIIKRFKLISAAFSEPLYKVDKELYVIGNI